MKYYIVDAFTDQPFGGNPAGVVLLEQGRAFPSDDLMQHIAAELRYSETAFVQHNGPAEFTVRYFTPRAEVDLCGHATIATFGTLVREGIVPAGTLCINHTLAGDLQVMADVQVMMQMAPARVIDRHIDVERLHHIMAGEQLSQCPQWPVEIVTTGLPDIIMPVASVEALHALRPDMDALAQLSGELEVTGVHAVAIASDDYTAHVRNFGPLYGVPEESATGTANAALTHWLQRRGYIQPGDSCRFVQGEAMHRPSVVATTLQPDGTIWVGGTCFIVARGVFF